VQSARDGIGDARPYRTERCREACTTHDAVSILERDGRANCRRVVVTVIAIVLNFPRSIAIDNRHRRQVIRDWSSREDQVGGEQEGA